MVCGVFAMAWSFVYTVALVHSSMAGQSYRYSRSTNVGEGDGD